MPQPAYIYARYSSAEQSKGSSLQRQLQQGKAYAESMGWEWDASRQLIDEGLSAYHGANRAEGSALHGFEQYAEAGRFTTGAVLLVENLDRLTRQGFEDCFDLLRSLTGKGVTVATWQDNHVFPAGERIDFVAVIKMLVGAERAREESHAKSKRLKASWNQKYDAAAKGERKAITRIVPGWLEMEEASRTILPIPARVRVLNEIYDWYIDGKGLPWIERELNQRGEPNWGRGKKGGKPWCVSRLHKYLTSPAVLGELTAKRRTGNGSERESRGIVIADYYPQVITAEKFNMVQSIRLLRRRWGGRGQATLNNLFSGIATCGACGGKMTITALTKAGTPRNPTTRRQYVEKRDRGYLACRSALRGLCSNKVRYPYFPLEHGVVSKLLFWAMRGAKLPVSTEAQRLTALIAEQERRIALKRDQIDTLAENLSSLVSPELTRRLVKLENGLESDGEELARLENALVVERAKAPPETDMQAIRDAHEALSSNDPEERYAARARTHQALKRLIDMMECNEEGETAIVFANFALGVTFARDGTCLDMSALNVRYQGPEGQEDWHPDDDECLVEQ